MDVKAPVLPSTSVYRAEPAALGRGHTAQRALPVKGRGLSGVDPFLRLDHVGPATFGPSSAPRSLGTSVLKGLETVTLLYRGDLRRRDSANNSTGLAVGDVLWETAGNGIVSELHHGAGLTGEGGGLELLRLWVNLPARDKSAAPLARHLHAGTVPLIPLTESGANYVRLVAGVWEGYKGPAHTYTPLTVADIYLEAGLETTIALDASWNTGVYLLSGGVSVNDQGLDPHAIATIYDEGEVRIQAFAASHLLLISGLPIAEPIASTEGFVMNTDEEVRIAEREAADGLYGTL